MLSMCESRASSTKSDSLCVLRVSLIDYILTPIRKAGLRIPEECTAYRQRSVCLRSPIDLQTR